MIKIFQGLCQSEKTWCISPYRNLATFMFVFITFLVIPKSVADTVTLWDIEDLKVLESRAVEAIEFRRRPILSSFWKETPNIRICADSGVRRLRAESAIEIWRRLGYDIGELYWDVGSPICRSNGAYGEIAIMLVNSDVLIEQNLAVTSITYQKDNRNIKRAVIYVLGGYANYPRLLEHELGHALGWGHFNRYLHIMNPIHKNTGLDMHGLTPRDYQYETDRLADRFGSN